MIRERIEIAILGAGFAGSLLAMMLQRMGRRVILLERGSHPRFSLGESSTPLANLALEEIARDYDLPWLANLAEFGKWKRHHPSLPVGLKRGFTFIDPSTLPDPNHANELLVTANPNDEVADTHWLRADFDAHLVEQAVAMGVPYLDQTEVRLEPGKVWHLEGRRGSEPIELFADFLVDATGPSGVLARTLGIESTPDGMRTSSWSIYSHFAEVKRWEDVSRELGGRVDEHPYHCDDAALHHVLDHGWMWVLRFDNGITSAGLLLDGRHHQPDPSRSSEEEWWSRLSRYPNVMRQFAEAKPTRSIVRTARLQRRARQVVGPNWAMLGPSAYTLDALYSTGNGHALQTVRRLARILERSPWKDWENGLANYQDALFREIDFLDLLVDGTYHAFRRFGLLTSFSMYYFAGAITAEERRKNGLAGEADEFLHSHDPNFRAAVEQGYQALRSLSSQTSPDLDAYREYVAAAIAPWNSVGLCDHKKRNLYPY